MLLSWLTERRRAKITAEPFDPAWEATLRRNVAHWRLLDDDERAHLRELIQVFVREKHWEGCGGLAMTDIDHAHDLDPVLGGIDLHHLHQIAGTGQQDAGDALAAAFGQDIAVITPGLMDQTE